MSVSVLTRRNDPNPDGHLASFFRCA